MGRHVVILICPRLLSMRSLLTWGPRVAGDAKVDMLRLLLSYSPIFMSASHIPFPVVGDCCGVRTPPPSYHLILLLV